MLIFFQLVSEGSVRQRVALRRQTYRRGREEDERVHFSSCPGTAENICSIFLLLVRHITRRHSVAAL